MDEAKGQVVTEILEKRQQVWDWHREMAQSAAYYEGPGSDELGAAEIAVTHRQDSEMFKSWWERFPRLFNRVYGGISGY